MQRDSAFLKLLVLNSFFLCAVLRSAEPEKKRLAVECTFEPLMGLDGKMTYPLSHVPGLNFSDEQLEALNLLQAIPLQTGQRSYQETSSSALPFQPKKLAQHPLSVPVVSTFNRNSLPEIQFQGKTSKAPSCLCGETVNPSNDKFASSALRCLINANKGLLWKSLAVVPLCFVDRVKKGLALAGAAHISCTGMTSVKIGAVRFFTINALDCFFIKKRFSQQMLESSEFICLVAQNVKAGLATMTDEEVSDLIVEISTKQR